MDYIAHKDAAGGVQTVKEHSEATSRLAEEMAINELKQLCAFIGMLHDIGKYQKDFQKRINGSNIKVEHSICGAQAAEATYPGTLLALLAELCVAGHHSGIPDCGTSVDTDVSTLHSRMKRVMGDYTQYKAELTLPVLDENAFVEYLKNGIYTQADIIEKFAFLVRYCFSCLVDADSLDTARACGDSTMRTLGADFASCFELIEEKLASFEHVTGLQKARARLLDKCSQAILNDADIYLMNMPTGSGKTLAGMRCALERLRISGKKRIIYVIPYNSIIEQTAEIFEKVFGEHAEILRHQSTYSYEDADDIDEDYRKRAVLATENWDAKIIITTSVQFFESMYSNKRGKLRKLHNMADSVFVFDEAHLMPIGYFLPCLRAIVHITRNLHSEAILLTATMPDFKRYLTDLDCNIRVQDLIIDKSDYSYFSKCKYEDIGTVSDEELVSLSSECPARLIIVNSRSAARSLYSMCGGEKYHLSTYMTAYDRSRVIGKIKESLSRLYMDYPSLDGIPEDRRITVVSTSLIEAGVDIDMTDIFRELSGLDNILQAGGRCNREGYRDFGRVCVFCRADGKPVSDIKANITKGIIKDFDDISSVNAVTAYYDRLYRTQKDILDKNSISAYCSRLNRIPFRQYAAEMRVIDDASVSVAVSRDSGSAEMIRTLMHGGKCNTRALQKYCASVKTYELEELRRQGVIESFNGIDCLTNPDYYDEDTGILFNGKDIYF